MSSDPSITPDNEIEWELCPGSHEGGNEYEPIGDTVRCDYCKSRFKLIVGMVVIDGDQGVRRWIPEHQREVKPDPSITPEPSDDELYDIYMDGGMGATDSPTFKRRGWRALFRAGVATHNTVSREQIAIEAVLELHKPNRPKAKYTFCECCNSSWPCRTVALLVPTSKETNLHPNCQPPFPNHMHGSPGCDCECHRAAVSTSTESEK